MAASQKIRLKATISDFVSDLDSSLLLQGSRNGHGLILSLILFFLYILSVISLLNTFSNNFHRVTRVCFEEFLKSFGGECGHMSCNLRFPCKWPGKEDVQDRLGSIGKICYQSILPPSVGFCFGN